MLFQSSDLRYSQALQMSIPLGCAVIQLVWSNLASLHASLLPIGFERKHLSHPKTTQLVH